jgi:hypothetical protein
VDRLRDAGKAASWRFGDATELRVVRVVAF